MTAKIIFRKKSFEVKAGMTLRHVLSKIDMEPESVLAIRDGELLTDDEIINDGETIKLVATISGG
ncbi:MoaD/ThiS family protein [Chloroflexota bacterium]